MQLSTYRVSLSGSFYTTKPFKAIYHVSLITLMTDSTANNLTESSDLRTHYSRGTRQIRHRKSFSQFAERERERVL